MCGITGIFCSEGLQDHLASLRSANNLVHHRGPDGAGFAAFYCDSSNAQVAQWSQDPPDPQQVMRMHLALGHRRLAIIDLSDAGLQPMCNRDRTLWITYNGEIYNYLELRSQLETAGYQFGSHSDTEVILAAYEYWQEDCVNRFNGMWAFALVDLRRQILFCSRDRFGVKPFYYYHDGRNFVFGSEIKQLLEFSFVPHKANERAIYEYLAFQAVEYDQETFFQGIRKLLHGHNLVLGLRDGTLNSMQYYTPLLRVDNQITYDEAASEFRRLLTDSVRLRLRSDVEVGSCLSGGLDSSSIVCTMHQLLQGQGKNHIQRTFSSHFDEKEANELEYMHEVIQNTSVRAAFTYPTTNDLLHDLECLVWHQDEPFGSTSIFAQWSVFKLASQHQIKVMLDGQGADELLAGYVPMSYSYFRELYVKKRYFKLFWEIGRHVQVQEATWFWLMLSRAAGRMLNLPNLSPYLRSSMEWIKPSLLNSFGGQSRYLANTECRPFGDQELLNNSLYQFTLSNNLQSLLKYEDRNSMAFSVESRVPFLDYRLVQFILSLPADFKIRNGYTKAVMREGMKRILPESVRKRVTKLGFATPELRWQQGVLHPLIREALDSEILHHFVLRERALSYLDYLGQHRLKDFAPWRWLNLSLWSKIYKVA